jgi:pseudaminic acid cytidylyltransferase
VKDFIALVPARGGSKRIPRKNVRPFLGTPAVVRTIRTILASGVVDRVIVSTDDVEIAQLAREAGAEVPDLRPDELADDHSSTVAVVRHAISAWMNGTDPAAPLLVVYPTAVLLTHELIERAADRFIGSDADFLIPVLRYPHPVERRLRISDVGLLVADEPQHLSSRTQDLEPAFHDAGQFYIGRLRAWMDADNTSPLASGRALAWELPPELAVDIDEPEHWARAEQLAAARMT